MKKELAKITASLVLLLFPAFSFADVAPAPNDSLTRLINNIGDKILQPIIWLLFALALFYFTNGIAQFMLKADDPKARAKGRQQMIWCVVGFFIMVSVTSILTLVGNTFGVHLPENTLTP